MRIFLLILLLLGASGVAHAAMPRSPVGQWLTQNGEAVIAIEPCGGDLCGRIVGITLDHPNDPTPRDWMGREQCGLTIIRQAAPQANGLWRGRIIDPRNGDSYHAQFSVAPDHTLHLRGYLGIPLLGQTQIWRPYKPHLPADCRMVR